MKHYELISQIKKSKPVCLIGHIEPDADALSSMIVFREFLKDYFKIKTVDIFAESKAMPEMYTEILDDVTINKEPKNYYTAIMLDCPNTERLGKYKSIFNSAKEKFVIDHHATNDYSGDYNIVEMCSSTCEIIYSILKYYKYDISKKNQGKLYAGIITDTNNFTVGNFGKRTMKIASECVENINKTEIYNNFLANNSHRQMQLLSIAIQNLTSLKHGQIIISHITSNDLKKYKASSADCSGIINKLATISGSKLVCFIYPNKNQFYVSMRAKENFDVSEIAKKNGGGGHKGAAAYLSKDELYVIEENIIKEFTNQIEKTKPLIKSLF